MMVNASREHTEKPSLYKTRQEDILPFFPELNLLVRGGELHETGA